MNHDAIELCLRVSRTHARLTLKLDEVLGTLHGLGWADYRLLDELATAEGGRLPVAALAAPLGLAPSALLRVLLPLEKTGFVQREAGAGGVREVAIRRAGRKVWDNARATVEAICAEAVQPLGPEVGRLRRGLEQLGAAPTLVP